MNFFRYFVVLKKVGNAKEMGQHIIILILFIAAVGYLGYMIFKNFRASGCPSGCGSCGIDFAKIQKELQERAVNKH